MNFELSKEEMDIKMAAREFAEGEIRDIAKEYDRKEEFPEKLWRKACELGFVGGFIREEYAGAGLSFFETCLIMEEFWRVDPGCGCVLLAPKAARISVWSSWVACWSARSSPCSSSLWLTATWRPPLIASGRYCMNRQRST